MYSALKDKLYTIRLPHQNTLIESTVVIIEYNLRIDWLSNGQITECRQYSDQYTNIILSMLWQMDSYHPQPTTYCSPNPFPQIKWPALVRMKQVVQLPSKSRQRNLSSLEKCPFPGQRVWIGLSLPTHLASRRSHEAFRPCLFDLLLPVCPGFYGLTEVPRNERHAMAVSAFYVWTHFDGNSGLKRTRHFSAGVTNNK